MPHPVAIEAGYPRGLLRSRCHRVALNMYYNMITMEEETINNSCESPLTLEDLFEEMKPSEAVQALKIIF
ncbi:MAG: hypothetical protein MZV63_38310 [Marinilabiliales bacterium]|nr:hypothetical protein [Marinilabiliales bacterium]